MSKELRVIDGKIQDERRLCDGTGKLVNKACRAMNDLMERKERIEKYIESRGWSCRYGGGRKITFCTIRDDRHKEVIRRGAELADGDHAVANIGRAVALFKAFHAVMMLEGKNPDEELLEVKGLTVTIEAGKDDSDEFSKQLEEATPRTMVPPKEDQMKETSKEDPARLTTCVECGEQFPYKTKPGKWCPECHPRK